MTTHPVAIMAMAQAISIVRAAQISGESQQHGGYYNNYKPYPRESWTEHIHFVWISSEHIQTIM